MRCQMEGYNHLTSTHDLAFAWSGLGSSMQATWGYTYLPRSMMWPGALGAFTYLSATALLHISAPALLSLQISNQTGSITLQTYGMPNYTLASQLASGDPFLNTLNFLPGQLSPDTVTILQRLNDTTWPALSDAFFYYIPDPNDAVGAIQVPATYFNVTCGGVHPDWLEGNPSTLQLSINVSSEFDMSIGNVLGGSL
jgi:hypothetical protein